MKILSITPLNEAHTDKKSIVVWTNEPLSSKCRYSFRIFETVGACQNWLQNQPLYNKRQAFSELGKITI